MTVVDCHTDRYKMKRDQSNIDQKLLVLYLVDEISPEDRHKVEAWLKSSEANQTFFESLERTWTATGKIDPASVSFDTGRAWDKMQRRIYEEVQYTPSRSGDPRFTLLKRRTVRLFIAAAAVLMLGVVSVVFTRYLQNRSDGGTLTLASSAVPVQDTLSDGSTIVLNTDTRLKVPKKFAQNNRTVELSGEAFFQVQHDAGKPFIIHAGLGQIKVLGTSFQVKAYPGSDLEVYVESGRVELSTIDSISGDPVKTVLKAGERGMIRTGSNEITKPAEIGADELFWANKKLIFQETKLSLVFELLKKHYDAIIEIKDAAILNCLLTATFTDESIGQILEVVTVSFDLKLSRDEEKFIINGKGCGNEME